MISLSNHISKNNPVVETMFTGIIEEVGTIKKVDKKGGGILIHVSAPQSSRELQINDSVAINGVCQTVIAKGKNQFVVEAVEETLKKTTLKYFQANRRVNLELPLKLEGRMGGHLVLGHIDCTGAIDGIDKRSNSWIYTIRIPLEFKKYVVPVGSITVDGVSLTIADIQNNTVSVSIIPHTMEKSIFKLYKKGDNVNLEFDIIGKYIERLVGGSGHSRGSISKNILRDLGY